MHGGAIPTPSARTPRTVHPVFWCLGMAIRRVMRRRRFRDDAAWIIRQVTQPRCNTYHCPHLFISSLFPPKETLMPGLVVILISLNLSAKRCSGCFTVPFSISHGTLHSNKKGTTLLGPMDTSHCSHRNVDYLLAGWIRHIAGTNLGPRLERGIRERGNDICRHASYYCIHDVCFMRRHRLDANKAGLLIWKKLRVFS